MPDSATRPTDTGHGLRVLIAADTFAPDVNGAARFAERLAAGLVERGHDVHVVAPASSRRHGTWVETHEGQQMTVHRLRSWRWYPHDWLRFALPWRSRHNAARILDAVRPDVVHSQSFLVVGRGMTIEARRRGIRVVATNHLMPENLLEFTLLPAFLTGGLVRLMWRDARRILGLASAVTTPTRRAADFLEQATGRDDVHAISCGIDASRYDASRTASGNTIVFVGRVTGEKQIDVLIRAFAELDPSLNARLEIVGDGDQRKNLQQLAADLGVDDRVRFTGYVTDGQLREAYARARVLAMPSIAELQSIVTMEAMASGLPVVAADAMALPHLVHDGENGYLFPPGDHRTLAARLAAVLGASDAEYARMSAASLTLIRPHDINNTLSTFESLYRGVPAARPDPVDGS